MQESCYARLHSLPPLLTIPLLLIYNESGKFEENLFTKESQGMFIIKM